MKIIFPIFERGQVPYRDWKLCLQSLLLIEKYRIRNVDYVVSGLPFASLPKNISNIVLKKTRSVLKKDGLFITFQYTLLKKEFIAGYFKKIELERVVLNVPPAYVLKCKNS